MIFETARLRVRELISGDFEPFHEMQADPEVMRYTTGCPQSVEANRIQLQ
jgi:RimJ/RimL family protein N-acetyltransferase